MGLCNLQLRLRSMGQTLWPFSDFKYTGNAEFSDSFDSQIPDLGED